MFFKIDVLKFHQIYRKVSLSESFLIKQQTPRNAVLLKRKLQHRCFQVKFTKFLKITFLQNIFSGWFWHFRFPPCNSIKKGLQQRCFCVNFAKFLKTSFDRIPADHCFLCLSVNFERSFSEDLIQKTFRDISLSWGSWGVLSSANVR